MNTQTKQKSERQYYIDWLRILLIVTVFLFHIGMIFNNYDWHIKNGRQYSQLEPVMSFLHLWRMPLLFLISGAGTFYALGKRTSLQYLKERFKRLFIPLIAGIFLLVPVQVYYERIDQYGSLLHFYPEMFKGIYPEGNFSWHHLWFIVYLFMISLLITPFLGMYKGRGFQNLTGKLEKLVTKPLGMNIILIPLVFSQLMLKPLFPVETHDLVNDWAFIAFNLIFFLSGFVFFVNYGIIDRLKKQRRLYLAEAFVFIGLLFFLRYSMDVSFWIKELVSAAVAWSCGITAIAYAVRYLNRDHAFRKLANEAIYPFYLLHQPAIIICGYYITGWEIPVLAKVLLITILSFGSAVAVYWFFIRPFNITRMLFGMRKRKTVAPGLQRELQGTQPALAGFWSDGYHKVDALKC
ncbi:MAG: acyltransferase family protein [Bacteroidota bacterium]